MLQYWGLQSKVHNLMNLCLEADLIATGRVVHLNPELSVGQIAYLGFPYQNYAFHLKQVINSHINHSCSSNAS